MGTKVTVVGGTGFVGSRVCQRLVEAGCEVTSVSKSGSVPKWCASEAWTQNVKWVANNLVRGPRETLENAIGAPDAIISCVGAIGFDVQGLRLGNGKANEEVARCAKKPEVGRFIYVSVSSEVADAAGDLLPGYFQGKAIAEQAIIDAVGPSGAIFIKPTFIYGGDGFGLFPPRVSTGYGAKVEDLLSKAPIQKIADILPGFAGLIKVALRPPVSVDAVAASCVRAALGLVDESVLDGTVSINAAADLPEPEPEPELVA